jgi:LPXTG-motif cell wall-anchored protein
MSTGAKQALILAAGGVALIALIFVLARRRLMTARYALGWMLIGLFVLLGSFLTNLAGEVGRVAGMTPTAVFLAAATILLLAIALQLSISVSGLQSQVRDLAEDRALLEDRVRDLEVKERR